MKYRFRGYKDYQIQVLIALRSTFYKAFALEQKLLSDYKDLKYQPLRKFKGHTEVLEYSCKNQLMSSMLEIASENSL